MDLHILTQNLFTFEFLSLFEGSITKIILAIAFVAMLALASISVSTGMTGSEKDAINASVVQALERAGVFSYVEAGVDSTNNLTIWSTSKSADENSTVTNLGYIIGVYLGAAKSSPDLSDLNIMIGTKDNVTQKMYCKRSWVDEVKVDSAGNMSDNDIAVLVLKVLGTLQAASGNR